MNLRDMQVPSPWTLRVSPARVLYFFTFLRTRPQSRNHPSLPPAKGSVH